MNEKKENVILSKSFSFAIRIVKLYQLFNRAKKRVCDEQTTFKKRNSSWSIGS